MLLLKYFGVLVAAYRRKLIVNEGREAVGEG